MSVCNYDYPKSPKAGIVLGKFKALNQTTGFELHRDTRHSEKHLDGCSAVRQHGARVVGESISEFWRPYICAAGWTCNHLMTFIAAL
jgi:hypothetical protein